MEGFDDPGIFFSDNFSSEDQQDQSQINLQAVKKKFKEFLRQFHEGNFNYKYRWGTFSSFFCYYLRLLFPYSLEGGRLGIGGRFGLNFEGILIRV